MRISVDFTWGITSQLRNFILPHEITQTPRHKHLILTELCHILLFMTIRRPMNVIKVCILSGLDPINAWPTGLATVSTKRSCCEEEALLATRLATLTNNEWMTFADQEELVADRRKLFSIEIVG